MYDTDRQDGIDRQEERRGGEGGKGAFKEGGQRRRVKERDEDSDKSSHEDSDEDSDDDKDSENGRCTSSQRV